MKIKCLLVDDEHLALALLENFIQRTPDLEVVEKCKSPIRAVEVLQTQAVDLLFLDIQMPGMNGFELLARLSWQPPVIFTTAYDEYALRAFEVNALDYLLKPIHPTRLERAIERLTNPETTQAASTVRPLAYDDRLFLEIDGQSRFLKVNAIVCIQAASDYSEIFTLDGRRLMVLKPLREWEERLPEQYFARIHRSAIINLEFVEHIENWSHRACRVFLRNMAEPLVISRRYVTRLKLKFG